MVSRRTASSRPRTRSDSSLAQSPGRCRRMSTPTSTTSTCSPERGGARCSSAWQCWGAGGAPATREHSHAELDDGPRSQERDQEVPGHAVARLADEEHRDEGLVAKHQQRQRCEVARHEEQPGDAEDVEDDHVRGLGRRPQRVEPGSRTRPAAGLDHRGLPEPLADEHGVTALMEAARAGASGIVQRLAEAKANVLARDQHGRDALILACQSPHADVATVRALLELGADAKAAGGDGRSALDHASAAGRWDLVALLDPDTALPANLSHDLLDEGADTPQHLLDALRFGHWATVSAFGERVRSWPQAELARLYLELATPGLGAARRWLLDHGLAAEARLEAPRIDEPDTGEAPTQAPLGRRLFDALLERLPDATEAVDDLMQAGASPAGCGLLAAALVQLEGAAEAAALPLGLLERGADPFGTDANQRTPLHLATRHAHGDLLQALLARGCDPNARDGEQRTPLFAALEHGAAALPLVRSLIAHGADPEAADTHGETPLGLALEHPALERWLDWRDWPLPQRPLRGTDLPAAAAVGALAA